MASIEFTCSVTRPHFTQVPDAKYMCSYCENILRPPVKQTVCGHRLCDACVVEVFRSKDTTMCPGNDECVTLRKDKIYPDIATTKEILRMRVYCPFKDKGCKADVKYSDLQKHEVNCEYSTRLFFCRNQGCKKQLLRKELKDHEQNICPYRLVLCGKCQRMVPKMNIDREHKTQCGCVRNKTSERNRVVTAKRSSMEYREDPHRDQPDLNTNDTKLEEKLQELTAHVDDFKQAVRTLPNSKQNRYLSSAIANLEDAVVYFKRQLPDHNSEQTNAMYDSVVGLHQDKKFKETFSDKSSQTSDDLFELQTRAINLQQELDRAPVGRLDALESSVNAHDVRFAEYDIRFRLLETGGYNGQLRWEITNYTRRKQEAVDGRTLSLYSQPFYTSYNGYKLCARVHLNGAGKGKGTHLSLFFVVMKGEYDALLNWPFKQRVTLAVLDQSGGKQHLKDAFRSDPKSTSFRRPSSEMNDASGSSTFVAQIVVEQDRYIRDDTLLLFVSVGELRTIPL